MDYVFWYCFLFMRFSDLKNKSKKKSRQSLSRRTMWRPGKTKHRAARTKVPAHVGWTKWRPLAWLMGKYTTLQSSHAGPWMQARLDHQAATAGQCCYEGPGLRVLLSCFLCLRLTPRYVSLILSYGGIVNRNKTYWWPSELQARTAPAKKKKVRIIQVSEVTIVNEDINCWEEPQVTHPGQDEAKQKVPVGFANILGGFIWFRSSRTEVNIGIPNAEIHTIVKPHDAPRH